MGNKSKIILAIIGTILVSIVLYFNSRTSYETDPGRRYIRADDGRILIMHGMNIFSDGKSHPLRVGDQDKEHIQRLSKDWGYNAVRLLIFWDGIEPVKGQYDYEYLQRVKDRLDWCQEAGLTVILDMHQDLYAVRYGGDGAPEWAIIDDGQLFTPQSPWELNYFEEAVKSSILNFWDAQRGHGELKEHYKKSMIEAIKFLGDHPSVIGIDLYNEPTLLTYDGFTNLEEKFLTPYYQELINEIRTVNNDIWIMYEPSAAGPNQGRKSSLGLLNDPREEESRLAYFPHIYTLDLDINEEYMGNTFFIDLWANARQEEYRKQDVPMLIGEFGLGGNDPIALEFVEEVVDMCDKISGGWFYWDYDPGRWSILDDQKNEVKKAKVLDRPYPRLIAGSNPEYSWNRKTNVFTFKTYWSSEIAQSINNPWTEIYLPRHTWPNGWKLKEIEGYLEWKFDEEKRLLHIAALSDGVIHFEITE